MVATSPGSDRLSSGSDRSRAAPAACSMVPMAPSATSTRPLDSSCVALVAPGVDGPVLSPRPRYACSYCDWDRLRLGLGQRVEDLECPLGDQPVPVVVEPQPGDLLDPLDPVGHRVRVDVQQPRGALRAVVLPEVAGEGRQVLRLVLKLVLR